MTAQGSLETALWHEPLRELAGFTFDFAPHFCDPAHGCEPYHKAWSTVRLYESGGALPAGIDFFRRELLDMAARLGTGRLRVMLSGAADTGFSTLVLQALRPAKIEPEFVIVDRCRTTLEQHRVFFGLRGVTAEFHQSDAVSVAVPPVDAILAHSFIGFIPKPQRLGLFSNWNRLLAPNGRVLLSERFLPDGTDPRSPVSAAERQHRLDRLVSNLQDEGAGEAKVADIAKAAGRLWDLSGLRQKMTMADFRSGVAEAGLRIVHEAADSGANNVSPVAPNANAERYPRVEAALAKAD